MTDSQAQRVEDVRMPLGKTIVYAVQHVLAMYTGTIAVPVVMAHTLGIGASDTAILIAAAVFVSGVGSLIQSAGVTRFIGVKLPLILGTSFVAMPSVFMVAAYYGGGVASLPYVFGGTLVAGVALFLLAPLYSKVSFLFKPVVIGSYLIMLGVSLLPVSLDGIVGMAGDPQYGAPSGIFIGMLTIAVIVLTNKFGRGFIKEMAILVGLAVASFASWILGMMDFQTVGASEWISAVKPLHFGIKFELLPIVLMLFGTFMASLDSVGTFATVGGLCNRKVIGPALTPPMRGEGIAVVISGLFNCTPLTSYINNAGVIIISGIRSRFVTIASGCVLILFSLTPKFAALAASIPAPVFGGATFIIFSLITVAGVEIIAKSVDMTKLGNMMVVGVSVSLGLLFNGQEKPLAQLPEFLRLLLSQGVIVTFASSVLLNLLFNFDEFKKKRNLPA